MNWEALAPWIAIACSVINIGYTIVISRSRKNDERFESQALRIGTIVAEAELLKDRVIVVENDMKHLPDKEVTHRLEVQLSNVNGQLAQLSERVKPIAAMADRMQEAMLEKVMS